VDAALLAETHLGNLDDLREEMCSERPTVDDFLAHSLAVCVAHGNDLVAWCLSEYDNGTMGRGRCEMGIFTHEAHRRKGLATAAALALAGRLHARGTRYIGWHCWRSNKASGATALRVGMELVRDYPVYFAAYDEAANLAINGNVRLRAGDSAGALPWFDRALATGRAPVWTHWAAACAAAGAGRRAEALERLSRSLDAGFGSAAMLRENQYLRDLHDAPEWPALMTRAEARERDVD
jgi:GNAT superfamily N-acetyltransferase